MFAYTCKCRKIIPIQREYRKIFWARDQGLFSLLISKDVLDDFLKEHGSAYTALDKCEQKSLNKALNKLCTTLVKRVYMSQAYMLD